MKDIKEITEKLEEGVKNVFEGAEYKAYLDFMSKFYNYSVNNTILIFSQMPTASLVAGFQTWKKKFNRYVKKGEKGIFILAPIPHKFKKVVEDEDGNESEKEINYTTFRAVSVFDISQTEGEAVPSTSDFVKTLEGDVDGYKNLLEKLESVSPVPVTFEDIQTGANGYFHLVENRIAIKEGMSELQTIKTLVHEISHAMLHDRENGEEKGANQSTKEVQAESVAYTVCNYLGLDTSDYSFGYVAGWSKGKEVKELQASMEVIRKTAGTIIEAVRAA